jgi:nicotinate phosphoribosyltransferase
MQAVRLDSGDLLSLSQEVRRILDESGRGDVKIVASGDLNEYKIHDLMIAGAPIDLFGVGTELVTSRDEPTLSTVYKLVEQETPHGVVGRLKLSADKRTHPFAKQIYRIIGEDRKFQYDLVTRATEPRPALEGEALADPLLTQIMHHGQLVRPLTSLEECRDNCRQQLSHLPAELLNLDPRAPYKVWFSRELEEAT